jgi:hypothetical protein
VDMCFYRVGEWAKLRDGVPESSILIIGIHEKLPQNLAGFSVRSQ